MFLFLKNILPKPSIHIVSVDGCMADNITIKEQGLILKTINKVIYGSTKQQKFYVCKFPSGIKELALTRCHKSKDTNIITYSL